MLDCEKFYGICDDLEPEDFIEIMSECLDENNVVYIPGWKLGRIDDSDKTYRCTVDLNYKNTEAAKKELNSIITSLGRIAACSDKLTANCEHNREILDDEDYAVWHTYLRAFESIDQKGKAVECKNRVGDNIFAFRLMQQVRRMYAAINTGASAAELRSAGRNLAASLVIHRFGSAVYCVDNIVRDRREYVRYLEFIEDDDKLDLFYKPMKKNGSKAMAPLYVYFILCEHSNCCRHLTQERILQYLEEKYSVTMERKALSRIIHALSDFLPDFYTDRQSGTWVEQEP